MIENVKCPFGHMIAEAVEYQTCPECGIVFNAVVAKEKQVQLVPGAFETCPACNGMYIQQDKVTKELYCLDKTCGNRWNQSLPEDISQVVNPYLRASAS